MRKFIPYQKLPKKQQRAMDREKRGSWGQVKPITRCPLRSDAYNRSKENGRWQMEAHQEHPSRGVLLVRAISVSRGASRRAA